MRQPFEVPLLELRTNNDTYVDAVFASLASDFLVMPKGKGFIEYPAFQEAYEHLRQAAKGFAELSPAPVLAAVTEHPLILIVLRTMLGFTPGEWAYITAERTGTVVSQGEARSFDRKIRMAPATPM